MMIRSVDADWDAFVDWCTDRGLDPADHGIGDVPDFWMWRDSGGFPSWDD